MWSNPANADDRNAGQERAGRQSLRAALSINPYFPYATDARKALGDL